MNVGLPWLDSVSTYAGARAFCLLGGFLWWAAIFGLLEGDTAGAADHLRAAIQKAGREDLRERLLAWGSRHGL